MRKYHSRRSKTIVSSCIRPVTKFPHREELETNSHDAFYNISWATKHFCDCVSEIKTHYLNERYGIQNGKSFDKCGVCLGYAVN